MNNEHALSPLQVLAIPFIAIAAGLLWLDDKVFGSDRRGTIVGKARRKIEAGEFVTDADVDLTVTR